MFPDLVLSAYVVVGPWSIGSVDEVVGVVGVVGLSLSESWLLSLCLVQMKEGL